MLAVTEDAVALLTRSLDREGFLEGVATRRALERQEITLQPNSERPGDATFQHEDRTVLLLDEQTSRLFIKNTLDVDGVEFALRGGQDSTQARRRRGHTARRRRSFDEPVLGHS